MNKELETIRGLRELKKFINVQYNMESDLVRREIYKKLGSLCNDIEQDKFSIGLAKYYIKRQTEEYIENGITCVKTKEYFNPYTVIDILNKNYENLESLIENFEKKGE